MALWYIDNSVGSSGAGTSWAAAWKDFSNIVWASVSAGDTIYISGGAAGSSQTYSTSVLTIGKSGTAGNLITITVGQDPSHSGTVIIDGSTTTNLASSASNIDTNGFTYLVIDGGPTRNIVVQNTFNYCMMIQNTTSGTILVQNLIIHTGAGQVSVVTNSPTTSSTTLHFASVPSSIQGSATAGLQVTDQTTPASIPSGYPPGATVNFTASATATTVVLNAAVTVASGDTILFAGNSRGIGIESNSGATITVNNCYVDTPASTTSQVDTMFTFNNSGTVVVENNSFIVNNTDASGHSDCIQSFEDTAITFRQNFLAHPNGGQNDHGFIVSDVNAGGTVLFYDNIIYMGSVPGNVNGLPEIAIFREFLTTGKTGTVSMWNNTIIGGNAAYCTYETAGTIPAGDQFKNNVIYTSIYTQAPYIFIVADLTTTANTDYNLVYAPNTGSLALYLPSASTGGARSTTSVSSGLLYFEIWQGVVFQGGHSLFGIANSTAALTSYLGISTNGCGYEPDTGQIYINGIVLSTIQTAANGDLSAVCIDLTHSKIWIKNITAGSGWNNDVIGNQNPATNTGGTSLSTLAAGPYFIMATLGTNIGSYCVLNAGGSSFAGTPPSGFSAWGATAKWNSSDISVASLTLPIGIIAASTYRTWAQWQTAGYDAHGVNSDPKFAVSVPPINGLPVAGSFEIQTGSGALNAGLTEATVTVDYYGASRPQQTSYAIGALEPNLLQSQACL